MRFVNELFRGWVTLGGNGLESNGFVLVVMSRRCTGLRSSEIDWVGLSRLCRWMGSNRLG